MNLTDELIKVEALADEQNKAVQGILCAVIAAIKMKDEMRLLKIIVENYSIPVIEESISSMN